MVAPVDSRTPERKLLDRAITTLISALAADEAQQSGASQAECADLRRAWVSDAESIVDRAEAIGLFDHEGDDDHE